MPAQFINGPQIDRIQKEQNEWLPRSPEPNGGGKQGARLVAQTYGLETLWANLAITDNVAHQSEAPGANAPNPTGTNFDQVYALTKVAAVTSTLNESVSVQPLWSIDGENWFNLGSPTVLTAYGGTGPAVAALIQLSTPSAYAPYVALSATCSTAPTSGVLNGILARLG